MCSGCLKPCDHWAVHHDNPAKERAYHRYEVLRHCIYNLFSRGSDVDFEFVVFDVFVERRLLHKKAEEVQEEMSSAPRF